MKRILYIIMTLLSGFVLGLYASQYAPTPTEEPGYRWIVTGVFALFFMTGAYYGSMDRGES